MNFGVVERLLRAGDGDRIGGYVADKAVRLERAGAIRRWSRTPCTGSPTGSSNPSGVPFVDMIEVTAATARSRGLSRVDCWGPPAP